jgi:dihydrofolate reductase
MSGKLAPLSLVVAMSRNRVIGVNGGLPWREPEDLKHFKQLTLNHAVIMGRKTYDSIGKPLRERRNLVVSRSATSIAGCEVFHDLQAAIAAARATDPEPVIIGGAEIYRQALGLVTTMHITEVQREIDGDTRFPDYDAGLWRESERRQSGHLVFRTLQRI